MAGQLLDWRVVLGIGVVLLTFAIIVQADDWPLALSAAGATSVATTALYLNVLELLQSRRKVPKQEVFLFFATGALLGAVLVGEFVSQHRVRTDMANRAAQALAQQQSVASIEQVVNKVRQAASCATLRDSMTRHFVQNNRALLTQIDLRQRMLGSKSEEQETAYGTQLNRTHQVIFWLSVGQCHLALEASRSLLEKRCNESCELLNSYIATAGSQAIRHLENFDEPCGRGDAAFALACRDNTNGRLAAAKRACVEAVSALPIDCSSAVDG